ncbi:alanine--tRNA ligase [Candidatus Bathyarchaeota archaeon]|nr:alanine--tRNA ligase [Candidatus Bathyarchaeota archaeon]
MKFTEEEYRLPFFNEYGYARKRCPRCGEFFWTLNSDQVYCGEATSKGCAEYTFIGNPPTRKPYSLQEMRESFLSFFEKRGHTRIKPYPLVARWRDDLYFTNASIIDFQPYVTEGLIPPPANPLVISQVCVRFPDLDSVGPTFGRHLTIFEMGGHHAFNYPDKEVYWKDETVSYHHEFVTSTLGIKAEEIVYKEGVWVGGGNAGPDLESIVRGLEVDTLVFMKYKVVNGEFMELPIRTVDTGYGIERFTWLSQGCISGFEAFYGELLDKIMNLAGIESADKGLLAEVSKVSGLISISKTSSFTQNWQKVAKKISVDYSSLYRAVKPVTSVYSMVDHTKCLAFLLAEGVVPSNVQEGYLTRLLIRRTYRLLKDLSIEDKMADIIDLQIDYWGKDFPRLKEMRNEILEMLSIEKEKYKQTLERGRDLVKRMIQEQKKKGVTEVPLENIVELYDSHGLTPEVVVETAAAERVEVKVPDNFYSYVAERHVTAPETLKDASKEGIKDIEGEFSNLPETRRLYYEDAYIKEFKAKVLRALGNRLVLDQTAFYPEGGGQPSDHGYLKFNGKQSKVIDVQKVGGVIIHFLEGPVPVDTQEVLGQLDWERRLSLMRHHTATHLVMGAARRILGEHVWQSGAQKDVERTRLDITHPKRLTTDEISKIERLANHVVMENLPVETFWLPREEAEKKYGFRLYQGGVVPGREIRVVKTENWEVEACGGTHCKSTGEVGLIKIIRTERIQDGVERLIFSAGDAAIKTVQNLESKVLRIADLLEVQTEKVENTVEHAVAEWKELRRDKERLTNSLAQFMAEKYLVNAETVKDLRLVAGILDSQEADVDLLIKVASKLISIEKRSVIVFISTDKNARVIVMVGKEAQNLKVDAREIAKAAAAELGGSGSGKPDFAQGGGTKVENVIKALEKAKNVMREKFEG